MNAKDVVTDHALVRYMERVMQLDLDAIRAEMLSDRNRRVIAAAPDCKIPVNNDQDLIVVNGRIVTVAPRYGRRSNGYRSRKG